jgi:hypothetical protein
VAGAVVLCLGAAGYGYWARSRPTAAGSTLDGATADGETGDDATADGATGEGQAAAVLLGLAVIVIGFCFAISQWTHIWTLRNLEIVAPALTWGVICLAAWAAGTATGRRRVATVAVAMLGLSLVPSTAGLTHPYKTDFRGLVEYLIAVRAEKPDANFVFLGTVPPWNWKAASDRPADDPVWDSLYRSVARYPRASAYPKTPNAGARTPVTQVVIYYRGTTGRQLNKYATRLVARLGPSACRRIPLHGVIVVRCH